VLNIAAMRRDESPELPAMRRDLLRRAKWAEGTIDDVEAILGVLDRPIPNPRWHRSKTPMAKLQEWAR
jgi:hypothetical protein